MENSEMEKRNKQLFNEGQLIIYAFISDIFLHL